MTRFDGRVALVTGGASGIGAAVVTRLLAEGAAVVLVDLTADAVDRAPSDELVTIAADVTVESELQAAVAAATEHFGRLDLAFNVAGGARFGTITDIAEQDWMHTVDLVLKGTFLGTRLAARAMRESGRGGAVVNVSSLNAHVPLFGASAYAAAKAGAENFTKSAALELAGDGIRVNAVLPGLVDTPLTAGFLASEELRADFVRRIPVRRPATPEEIASPILYLASDEASYVNGTSLVVDGGWEITNYPDLSAFL